MTQPLTLMIRLTEEQRRQILEQTGQAIDKIPVKSAARFLRTTFAGLPLRVARGVFVPSTVTERLLEQAIASVAAVENPAIVEVGTGCGAVALAIARERPDAAVTGTDISAEALQCARSNRRRLRLSNVRFSRGSLLEPLPARMRARVATIVANVPYVPPRHAEAFSHFFPEGTAVGAGPDGLDLVRALADNARHFLAPNGSLVLQLAGFQWAEFAGELRALGYNDPKFGSAVLDENAPAAATIRFPASR